MFSINIPLTVGGGGEAPRGLAVGGGWHNKDGQMILEGNIIHIVSEKN